MNDGANGDVYSEIDSVMIRDKPQYTLHTTTAPSILGATYLFKVEAYNINGSTFSEPARFVLADFPGTPPTAPTSDFAISSETQLKIDIAVIVVDGGSPILSYSLEIDDGLGGPFRVIFGTVADTLATRSIYKQVERGLLYRTRYRVRNAIGWSDYSPIGYLRAASPPYAPPAPAFVAATADTITVKLDRS